MKAFLNDSQLCSEIVSGLAAALENNSSKSWNIVIPPGFFSGEFNVGLLKELGQALPDAIIANVAADGVYSPTDLLNEIAHGWGIDAFKLNSAESPQAMLNELIEAAAHKTRILIIDEFQKILSHMDDRILVALRNAEQFRRIYTITIAIYPYRWLKLKWKREGQLLKVSNYGDTHAVLQAEPYDTNFINHQLHTLGFPESFGSYIHALTGGIPEAVHKVLTAWQQIDEKVLTPANRQKLKDVAADALHRFASHIDPEGTTRFSDSIINMHQHCAKPEDQINVARHHTWRHILIDKADLAIEVLGDVLTNFRLEQELSSGVFGASVASTKFLAFSYYEQRQYDIALNILRHIEEHYFTPELDIFLLHAEIMYALCGHNLLQDSIGIDSDWKKVLKKIAEAKIKLEQLSCDERFYVICKERYDIIENMGHAIVANCDNNKRCIDSLGGFDEKVPDKVNCIALLWAHYEAAKGLRGNFAASKTVLELPEQIIRLWALWRYGISYYSAPATSDHIRRAFKETSHELSQNGDLFICPELGEPFPSVFSFCCYVRAYEAVTGSEQTWESVKSMNKELSALQVRRDIAHATIKISSKMRQKLFDLIDIWLKRLEECCDKETDRLVFLGIADPLPVDELIRNHIPG